MGTERKPINRKRIGSQKKSKIKKGKECLQINNLSFKPLDPFGVPIKNLNLKLL